MKEALQKAFLILVLASFALNAYFLLKPTPKEGIKRTVVRVEKIDTIHDTVPQLISKTVIKTKLDTFILHQVITNDDDTTKQTAVVEVPYEQKVYARDSMYKAWVSGFNVNLDSIRIYFKSVTVTETIEKTIKDNKRFGIGPYVGAGYDFSNKQFGWGVGVSLQYNLIKF